MRAYTISTHKADAPSGRPVPPPSFFSPLYEPSTFPTDNLAAMMKNHMMRFPSRTKIIKSPIVSPEHDPFGDKWQGTDHPTTTLG